MNRHRNYKKRNNRNERGVALLFAIGFLSLMIMLCVSFSMESLQSQKVAANNSNRSAAKTFAQSALRHVSTAVMFYVDDYWDKAPNGSTNVFVTDFSHVISRDKDEAYVVGSGKADIKKDMLANLLPFTTPFVKEDHNAAAKNSYESHYKKDDPQWIYVYDESETPPTGQKKPIIGRFAYRILPPASSTQLNLAYFATGKQSMTEDLDKKLAKEISFLNCKDDGTAQYAFKKIGTPLEIFAGDPVNKNFFGGTVTDASYDWTQRFFSDGACPPDLEIFKVENNGTPYYYHRYNIAEELRFSDDDDTDDEKVSSLLKKDANKLNAFSFETLVDEKLSDNKTDDFIKRSWYKYVSGNSASQEHNFFFLGMIADEPGSFVNVETRRKQIVANFIDYYDKSSSAGNSIPDTPTSDVKPSDWGTGVLPSYTGNEKTFYINELGVVSKFNVTANARTLDVKVTPTLLAEIVGIYKNLDNGNYKLKSKIESISFDISGTVTKTKGTNGAESDSDISFGGDGAVLSGSASFVDSPDLEVSFTGSPSNGYLASSAAHGAVSVPVEISAVPADQSISEFTAEIKNIKIKFKDRAVLSKSNHNVDISRLPLSECDVDQNGMKLEFSNSSADNCAVIGNMSVIDPRQNLYVRTSNADGCTYSDWYFLPKIVKVGTGDYIGSDSDLSMAVTISDAGAIESLSGSVNKYSNPNIPRRVSVASGAQVIQNIPDGDCDIETANDPAYTNASSLSTAYIRDGYMQSMWELGLIHRGAAWETINLQSTAVTPSDMYNYLHSSFAGTKYGDGDAAILDTVKISKYAVNWGMYDINMLRTNAPGYDFTGSGEDRKLFKTIAESLVKYTSPDEATSDGLLSDGDLNVLYTKLPSKMDRRSMLVNSFDAMFEDRKTYWETDALREQAIGTLMPLLKAEPALVTVFHVDVVAQTIRDIGDVKVSKLKSDGTLSDAAETKLGEFDAVTDGSGLLYLDDITGQVKLRATFDCNPYTGKIKLRQIRYLD